MFSQALEIVATNGWLITLCGLSIYFVIASGFLTAKSSLSAPKPSISQRQHLLEVRERQQAQAEEARKAAGEEKVGRKTTVGQAFAKIEEREKRKKSFRGNGGYNHLLGQQGSGYRPTRRTARRG